MPQTVDLATDTSADTPAEGVPSHLAAAAAPMTVRAPKPRRKRPRIARRFVPPHSLALTLDGELSPRERLALLYLLSKPRQGAVIYGVTAGEVGHAVDGCTAHTARTWLRSLIAHRYLHIMPGKQRGQLTVVLGPKATRWMQLREPDLEHYEKAKNGRKPPLFVGSRPLKSASNTSKEEKKEEAHGEDAATPAELPALPAGQAAAVPTMQQLRALAERAKASQGTTSGPYLMQVFRKALAAYQAVQVRLEARNHE